MDILIYLRNIIKIKDPNSISSFKDDIKYDDIKKLWEIYLSKKELDKPIIDSFKSISKIGSVSKKLGVLNIYSKKDSDKMFGLFYCKGETKYLEIKSEQLKNILNFSDDVMVLTYIIRLPFN